MASSPAVDLIVGDNPGLDKFHVHIRCFAAWEFERSKAQP
jgi:hypothetical protein